MKGTGGIRKLFALAVTLGVVGLSLTATGPARAAEPNITIDGFLEQAYANEFAELRYTRDSGKDYTGLLSVLEGDQYYYFGFQQSLSAKSNAYCDGKQEGCDQKFNSLVGSDYISFEWGDLYVPVDILTQSKDVSTPSGYIGRVGTGDGGRLEGASASDVIGFSAMDYNLNVLGWRDLDNSPNFAGQSDHPYIYPSIAEVRIAKSAFPSGLDPRNPTVVVHNSPEGETEVFRAITISCPANAGGTTGSNVSLTVTVTENSVPKSGQPVLVLLTGPGKVVSVGGTAGNRGTTGSNGTAEVVLTSDTAGTTNVRAVLDLDNDGVWDQATEPSTEPTCPVTWTQRVQVAPEIEIVKTGPAEARRGDTITYTMKVRVPIDVPVHNVVVSDPKCDPGTLSPPTKTGGDQDDILEFGEVWTYTCTHLITQSDPDPLPNTSTVTGLGPNDEPVSDEDSHLVPLVPLPVIKIQKSGPQTAKVGETITYTLEVSIPIDRPLHDINVTDPKCDGQPRLQNKAGGDNDNLLELGEVWVYTCDHKVTAADLGVLHNTADVVGKDERDKRARDEDSHNVEVSRVKAAPPEEPPPPSGPLPFTGFTATYALLLALGLLTTGALSLMISRREAIALRRRRS